MDLYKTTVYLHKVNFTRSDEKYRYNNITTSCIRYFRLTTGCAYIINEIVVFYLFIYFFIKTINRFFDKHIRVLEIKVFRQ